MAVRKRVTSFGWLRQVAFAMLAWGAAMTGAMANEPPATDDPTAAETQGEPSPAPPAFVSFTLGEFVLKDHHPVEQEQVKVFLTLHAEVPHADAARFEKMWPEYEHRVRSQVITATRLVTPLEFDDPELKALLRRIYLRLRRALPELPIEQVYVSDFSYLVE